MINSSVMKKWLLLIVVIFIIVFVILVVLLRDVNIVMNVQENNSYYSKVEFVQYGEVVISFEKVVEDEKNFYVKNSSYIYVDGEKSKLTEEYICSDGNATYKKDVGTINGVDELDDCNNLEYNDYSIIINNSNVFEFDNVFNEELNYSEVELVSESINEAGVLRNVRVESSQLSKSSEMIEMTGVVILDGRVFNFIASTVIWTSFDFKEY